MYVARDEGPIATTLGCKSLFVSRKQYFGFVLYLQREFDKSYQAVLSAQLSAICFLSGDSCSCEYSPLT